MRWLIKSRKIFFLNVHLISQKNISNLACSTTLSVLFDYLSVALSLSRTVHIKMKVWGYSVDLVALVPALHLSAIRLDSKSNGPLGALSLLSFSESHPLIPGISPSSCCLSFVHQRSASSTRLEGNLLPEPRWILSCLQKTVQVFNDKWCGVCGRRSTGNVFVRLSFSGKDCRAYFIIQQSHGAHGVHMACFSRAGNSL